MLQNYYTTEPVQELISKPDILMAISYGGDCLLESSGLVNIGLEMIGNETVTEIWQVPGSNVERRRVGRCHLAMTEQVLSASLCLTKEECQSLTLSTKAAYSEIMHVISEQGYRYPVRIWNYIPDINHGEDDEENYKQFCAGRLAAFSDINIGSVSFPAASAVGHRTEGALISMFAVRQPPENFQNPQQVNAFDYPRQYGIASPSFSRATSYFLDSKECYFLSGTASIVGHESTHDGDLSGQLTTTIENLQKMILKKSSDASLQTIKVYLRFSDDFPRTKSILDAVFPNIPIVYLKADICRSELLVEVEGYLG